MSSFPEWHPDFELAPPIKVACGVFTLHIVALVYVIWVSLPYGMQWYFAVAIVGSLGVTLLRLGMCRQRFSEYSETLRYVSIQPVLCWLYRLSQWRVVTSLAQTKTKGWELGFENGRTATYRLLPGSVVTRHVIGLRFLPINARAGLPVSVLITPERIAADDYRRLQVLLRWQSKEGLGI